MMEPRANSIRHTSLQEAAQWYVELQEDDCSTTRREQWRQWLEQHSEHQAAWHYVERVGRHFAPLRERSAQAGGVLRQTRTEGISRRQTTKALLLLGVGSLIGLGSWKASRLAGWTADLATRTAESRKVRMENGAELWLGARTAVDTDSSARRLDLLFGEVLLQTVKQDLRSFFIRTECGELEIAPGANRIGVRQREGRTRLDVYQGAATVRTASDGTRQDLLAGQGIDFTATTVNPPTRAQEAGQSWTRGILAAEAMPLSELIETLGRYRHGYLGYAPDVADLSVMGTFPLGDTDQALQLLEAALPVRVRRLTELWVSIEPA